MNIGRRIILTTALALLPLAPAALQAQDPASFKDDKEKASYAIGLYFGNNIKGGNLEVDTDVMMTGIKDVLAGRDPKLTQPQAKEAITTYQQASRAKALDKNRKEGEAFLAANKSKDGVKVWPVTLPDGTTAEMQYKVLTEGTGATPLPTDMVKVNYRGTLINGTEFDNSAKRNGGQPAPFAVKGVIRGWTEALQQMKVGSKWQLFVPASLAYGDRGSQGIEPASTLIFEVELVDAHAPVPPPEATTSQPRPLTSDIIRVPSAEEMKKGAQVETIKASDLEKTNATSSDKKK